jgi:enoyl-CoA hydratase/carnithine racemase
MIVPLDTSVNIAFPAITERFGLGRTGIQWVVICYVLTYGSLMLGIGRLGDIFGYLRVFRLGLAWSILAFILCATAENYAWLLAARVMQGIVGLPQPVIAAVQGVATAAGCQLVASCDLAVAAEEARFCTPGVDIGLFCSTPAVALARAVPRKAAMEMLLLGEMVPAEEAQRLGLVNRLAPRDALMETALGLAARIAS